KNYFKLNKENTKDGRDHYFYFSVDLGTENKNTRIFKYRKHLIDSLYKSLT
ncbi:DUF5960 family protein, partial [Streptococcus sanguinis]